MANSKNEDQKHDIQNADSANISVSSNIPEPDDLNISDGLTDRMFSMPDTMFLAVILTEEKEGENKVRNVVIEIPPDMEGR